MKSRINKIKSLLFASLLLVGGVGGGSSCSDWLDVKPNNEKIVDEFWQSKEDVEEIITSGYYYMRDAVPTMIKWGELRGGSFYSTSVAETQLQDFNITETNSLCNWSKIYQVIGMANSIIKYAPEVSKKDDTYYESMMNSHLCEAYWMRAYCYLILVKNYKEVPLILDPYVTDEKDFDCAKSTEAEIIAQIKSDVKAALATNAAKGTYETAWQTKGRATKWALYALMADVCLWNGDFQECAEYADMILNATDAFRPVFLAKTEDWYSIFYPGNSNESIFEFNWDYNANTQNNNFSSLFTLATTSPLRMTSRAVAALKDETQALKDGGMVEEGRMGRMLLATFVPTSSTTAGWTTANEYYVWKYRGTDVQDIGNVRVHLDANFIIYRVAEVMLMKAQALTMLGGTQNYKQAIALVNKVRNRACLDNYLGIDLTAADADAQIAQSVDELSLLEEILDQKDKEFIAEGKRWYDVLWLGRVAGNKYQTQMINMIIEGNQTTNQAWIRSVLTDRNSWYMPVPYSDLQYNKLLEQNPYYSTTK